MMNERFNNNSGAPCCFASIEPNAAGTGNSHVQLLFTIHCPNGGVPAGFIAYLNNCIWTVGVQPKCSSGQARLQDVRIAPARNVINIRPYFDFNEFVSALLYMMKDKRQHNGSLSYSDQRVHHSRIKIGIQPGGLMISYLPQVKEGYKTFFGQTRVLAGVATINNTAQNFHHHHFPPDFPDGNFHGPQLGPEERIVQLAAINHDRGTSRISVNQWRRRSSRNGGRVGYT